MDETTRNAMRAIMHSYLERGDETGWFEAVYANAQGDPTRISWADLKPNPLMIEWLDQKSDHQGRVLKIGCGLGDDAEILAQYGYEVVAFDIAPTAIAWCHQRFPDSQVVYQVADLLNPPSEWLASFDLVIEIYTLQVLTPALKSQALQNVAKFIKPLGELWVICRGRDQADDPGKMPYPLTKEELNTFVALGLTETRFDDLDDHGTRRFRVAYHAP
ncbi:MAG: class I SAM-dependent methyltransferase [Anaerolineae bacterium]|nr:class I SAM-dependent methyltransferase [Anaerolineae bacterium]